MSRDVLLHLTGGESVQYTQAAVACRAAGMELKDLVMALVYDWLWNAPHCVRCDQIRLPGREACACGERWPYYRRPAAMLGIPELWYVEVAVSLAHGDGAPAFDDELHDGQIIRLGIEACCQHDAEMLAVIQLEETRTITNRDIWRLDPNAWLTEPTMHMRADRRSQKGKLP